MYDPINDVHYEMIIESSHGTILGGTTWDSIYFYNFGNLFNLGNGVYSTGDIDGTNIQPLKDKNGYRWNFSNYTYPDYQNRRNVMIGDSIYLYQSYDNTAFWINDGISYMSIDTVHYGKKIH